MGWRPPALSVYIFKHGVKDSFSDFVIAERNCLSGLACAHTGIVRVILPTPTVQRHVRLSMSQQPVNSRAVA